MIKQFESFTYDIKIDAVRILDEYGIPDETEDWISTVHLAGSNPLLFKQQTKEEQSPGRSKTVVMRQRKRAAMAI